MEGNFNLKFDSKESYQQGVKGFMEILSVWKSTEDRFVRDYDIVSDVREDDNQFLLKVKLSVAEKSDV